MGLDITCYRQLTKAIGNEAFNDTGELKYGDGWEQLFHNWHFPGRADDIQDGCAYRSMDSGEFRAGSYGGYNLWREQLAKLAGYEKAARVWDGATGPFCELIHFSDCEGTIGTAVSAKLAKDFAEFQAAADAHADEKFRRLYAEWRRAFEVAADGGAVQFG